MNMTNKTLVCLPWQTLCFNPFGKCDRPVREETEGALQLSLQ